MPASAQVRRDGPASRTDETKPVVLKKGCAGIPAKSKNNARNFTSIASASFACPVPLLRDGRPSFCRVSLFLSLLFSFSPETTNSPEGPELMEPSRRVDLPRALFVRPLELRTVHVLANRPRVQRNFRGDRNRDNVHTCPTASTQLNFRLPRLLFILTWRRQVLQVAPPSDLLPLTDLAAFRGTVARANRRRKRRARSFSLFTEADRLLKISINNKKNLTSTM